MATVFALKQVCAPPFNFVYFHKGRQQKNLMKIYLTISLVMYFKTFIKVVILLPVVPSLCLEVENPNIREILNCHHLSNLQSLNGKTSRRKLNDGSG